MEYISKGRPRAQSSTYNTSGGYPSSAHGHRGTSHRREDSRGESSRNQPVNCVLDNEGHRTGLHRRQSHSQGPVDGNGYRIHVRKRSDKPAYGRENEPSVESAVHRLAEIRLSQEAQERNCDRLEKSYKSKKYFYSDKRPDPYYDSWEDDPPVQKGPHSFRPRQSHRDRAERPHKPLRYHSEKRPGGATSEPYYDSWDNEPRVEKGRRSFEPRYSQEGHGQYRERHVKNNGSSNYSRGYSDYYTSYGTSDHDTGYSRGDYSRGRASSDYYRSYAGHEEKPSYRGFYDQCTDPGGKRGEKARRQREEQARKPEEPFHGFVEGEVSDAEDYLNGGSGHTN